MRKNINRSIALLLSFLIVFTGVFFTIPMNTYAAAPVAPTNLVPNLANEYAGPIVSLTWGSVTGAISYNIYKTEVGGTVTNAVYTSASNNFKDTAVTIGKTYNYYVTAVNAEGASSSSNVVTVYVAAPTYKFDFGIADSSGNPQGALEPGWTQVLGQGKSVTAAVTTLYTPQRGYGFTGQVSGRANGTAYNAVATDYCFAGTFNVDLPVGEYSISMINAEPGASSKTKVTIEGADKGIISKGKNDYSETTFNNILVSDGQLNIVFENGSGGLAHINGLTITPVRLAPTNLSVSNVNLNIPPSVSLAWNQVPGATSYNIYRAIKGETDVTLIGNVASSSFTDNGVKIGRTYIYKVAAINANGESVKSSQVTAEVFDPSFGTPSAPIGGTVDRKTDSAALKWTAVSSSLEYSIYRATVADATYSSLVGTSTTPNYTDIGLTGTANYYYYLSVVTKGGESPKSAPIQAFAPKPAAPATLNVDLSASTAIGLSWNKVDNALSYKLYRATAETGPYTLAQSVNTLAVTDTNLLPSTNYYYKVTALNEGGESELSKAILATTKATPTELPSNATAYKFDFGPGRLENGYIKILDTTKYIADIGYGFANPSLVSSKDRGTSDALKSDFCIPGASTFNVDLANGDYSVSIISGDELESTAMDVKAEGLGKLTGITANAGEYKSVVFTISLIDGQLNLEFPGTAPRVNAIEITKLPEREAGSKPTIYIAGDSTVQTYDPSWKPQGGWGQMIPRYFSSDVLFDNRAIGGRSSKSFILEGRLDAILGQIKKGDYLFVQFGHNDATISRPERYCTPEDYKKYLKTYIDGVRQRGATPVLVTPVARRSFNPDGTFNISFPEYRTAMMEVASENNVYLVDLGQRSTNYLTSMGVEMSTSIFLHLDSGIYDAFPNGNADDTHFQEFGAIQMARLLSEGVKDLNMALSPLVRETKVTELPAVPIGLEIGTVSSASVAMKWNAANGADLYKIYRATVTNGTVGTYALVGTSTITTFNDAKVKESTEYSYKISAVNGLGESGMSNTGSAKTKTPLYKFDFGTETSAVAAGYTKVANTLLYTKELGYGLSTKADTRDRGLVGGATNDMERDFILASGNTFSVDLSNGDYSLKIIAGDPIGNTDTTYTIEGITAGNIKTGKTAVGSRAFNARVSDGQLNIGLSGNGYMNGLEITPVFMAPTELKVSSFTVQPTQSATLAWKATDGARSYNIYRKASGDTSFKNIGNTSDAGYVDNTVEIGVSYTYRVVGVNAEGKESIPTNEVIVSLVDSNIAPPSVPTGVSIKDATSNTVSLKWNAESSAIKYYVYRATEENGVYSWIGRTTTAEYVDTTVSTHMSFYYKIAAVNAGGLSDKSETVISPIKVALIRQMEKINRGLVATKTDKGIYIGWRMFGTDLPNIAFNLYRDGKKINTEPIVNSTNYLDESGTEASKYFIRTVLNGKEQETSEIVSVWSSNYLSIPISKPSGGVTPAGELYTYSANDATVADLDGDGQYEIILNWQPSNAKDNSQDGYTGNVYVDAYKFDGTRLWRIDLGKNIRAGAHYLDILAYDFDGDGKAEVTFRTADGTIDGQGNIIGNGSADYRNSSGRINTGPEFHTVFEGATGRALDTEEYEPARGNITDWGDGNGNRADRFLAAIAYLDGKTPSIIMQRGYYTRLTMVAYNWKDGKLTKQWMFDSNDEGNDSYYGQGNHQLSVADVDGDGYDEIFTGPAAIDHDGKPLWNTKIGHGDALHLGDLDPTTPGYEIWKTNEGDESAVFINAKTGDIRFKVKGAGDVGRGLSADIDPNYPGDEVWASIPGSTAVVGGLYNNKGDKISSNTPSSTNFAIWWDGDLQRELFDHNWDGNGTGIPKVDKWDYVNKTTLNLATFDEMRTNNWSKGNPCIQADLLGDWREELLLRDADSTELRLYTTNITTDKRIYTLMHDSIYRLGVAWQNVGYNQPPHTSFFLGNGMTTPPMPKIGLNTSGVTPILSSAPTGLRTSVNTSDSITLSWDVVEGANAYKVFRVDDGSELEIATVTGTSFTDSGLMSETTYGYIVSALNAASVSAKSDKVNAQTASESSGDGSNTNTGVVVPPVDDTIKNPDGSTTKLDKTAGTAITEINANIIANKISKDKIVEIMLPSVSVPTQELKLSKEAIAKIVEAKADVKLTANGVTLNVPIQVIQQNTSGDLIISTKKLDVVVPSQVGDAFEVKVERVSGDTITQVTSFDKKIKIELPLPNSSETKINTKKLGIYYQDEQTKQWRYAGGKYNKTTQKIETETSHVAKFAVIEYSKKFSDVASDHWAKEFIEILAAKHITQGINDTEFDPTGKVTRAQFASFIVRALEVDTKPYNATFGDVPENAWYALSVEAAKNEGLVAGDENGLFVPDAEITREEMAVMVMRAYNYVTQKNISEEAKASTAKFADFNTASSWSRDAILAAQSKGIINGMTDNTFEPKETAQREQAAKILIKLLEVLDRI